MSKVHVSLHRDAAHSKAPITGPMRFAPSRRRSAGQDIILPAGFDVDLVDGEAIVELDATGPDWCWTAYEPTIRGIIRSFLVPDVPDDEVLEYSSLPDVDPATLEPSAEPEAAWWAALEAGAYSVAATPDPDDPHVLLVRYPVWRAWPGDPHSIAIPVLVGGISQ